MRWKQIIAVPLILAFCASTFCRTAIVLDYFANSAAYAKNCINKARPVMHCNGKCQMMKKLEQEEKNNQDSQSKPESKMELVFSHSFCQYNSLAALTTRHAQAQMLIARVVDRHYVLLRPPSACQQLQFI